MTALAPTGGVNTLRAWLLAARPATLPLAIGPVAVGTALAARDGAWHIWSALAALVGAILIQIGTNLYNDYGDFIRGADDDHRLGPARATQRGWMTPDQVRAAALAAFAAAGVCGLYLAARGGAAIVVLGLCSIAAGIAYTGGPWPLAYVGLGDVFVLAFFGIAAVAGSHYVQTGVLSWTAIVGGAAVGALATAVLVVNNLRDRVGDDAVGKRTLVVRFGDTFGRFEYLTLVLLAYALMVLLALGTGDGWLLLPCASLPLAMHQVRALWHARGADLNPHLSRTAKLALLFNALFAVGAW